MSRDRILSAFCLFHCFRSPSNRILSIEKQKSDRKNSGISPLDLISYKNRINAIKITRHLVYVLRFVIPRSMLFAKQNIDDELN